MKICVRFLVSGHVQGVCYRASTQHIARQMGLTGYAHNLDDGNVEILACGSQGMLHDLETWLWQGPAGAQITGVSKNNMKTLELNSFEIT